MLAPLTAACLAAAAHAYQIPTAYLYAILAVEGGRVGQSVADKNGTRDLGPFQINSGWGQSLGRFWSQPGDKVLERVADDGCANAIVAAAILAGALNQARGDLPRALGLYHSHTAKLAEAYRQKILIRVKDLEKRAN